MRIFICFCIVAIAAFSFESVYKYAYSDDEIKSYAVKASEAFKTRGAHLGLIERSDIFEGEGGLAALKMGYIEILAINAQQLQYIIPSVWVKLEAAKKGDDQALREELNKLGFTLIKTRFFKNKTIAILANASAFAQMPADRKNILLDSL
jgi:hypothetical protein